MIASFERRQLMSWPVLTLFCGWSMSVWVFTTFETKQQTFEQYRLQGLIDDRQNALTSRMRTYIVIGHLKTGQRWPHQNQPLGGWLG